MSELQDKSEDREQLCGFGLVLCECRSCNGLLEFGRLPHTCLAPESGEV